MLQEVDFVDSILEQRFRIKHSDNYTVISVGARDFYFKKDTGEFDGTGYAFCGVDEEGIRED